jgi:hypothetical protein
MPRRVYLLGVGLTLVALALAITDWALSLRPGVTEANVKRIRPGMTTAEVEAILGSAGVCVVRGYSSHGPMTNCRHLEFSFWRWSGPAGRAWVYVDDSSVVGAGFERSERPNPLARLRAWLGW